MAVRSPTHRLLVTLFFASGASALVQQLVIQQLLGRALGATTSGAAPVAASLAGLAAGCLLGARLARRASPRRTFALFEVSAALAAVIVPRLVGGATALEVALAGDQAGVRQLAARAVVTMLVAAPPALLLGLTLPLAARLLAPFTPAPELDRRVSALHGAALLGGAAGAIAAGYALVPLLGATRSLLAAAAGHLLVAAVAFSRRARESEADFTFSDKSEADFTFGRRSTVAGAFGSGLLALALAVVWFRLLAIVVGASASAFALMLSALLGGVGLGAVVAGRGRLRRAGPGGLAALQLATSAAILATLPLWQRVPSVFVVLGRLEPGFALAEAVRLGCVLALLWPPTLMLGAAFALVLRLGARGDDAPDRVGRVWALGTAGAVVGVLVARVLLPLTGARAALMLLALASAALAVVSAWPLEARTRRLAFAAALLPALIAAAAPRWDLARLASGANIYLQASARDEDRLLSADEDGAAFATVVERSGARTLLLDGRPAGSDGPEARDHAVLALAPLLFVHHHDAALDVGIGTGASLHAMAALPFRVLEAVDPSRSAVDAARRWFGRVNGGVLDAGRVRILVEDGRARLLAARGRYDLISLDAAAIWPSGAGDLHGREAYQLVRARLAPGGVLEQRLPLHHLARRELATAIATLRSVFPHVTLWLSGREGALLASEEPLTVEPAALAALAEPARACALPHPLAALGHLYLDTGDVDRLIADVAATENVAPEELVSTDDQPRLEAAAQRGNLLPHAYADNLQLVHRFAMTRLQPLLPAADPSLRELMAAYAAHERGFDDLARAHAQKAGAAAAGTEHESLRRALGLD